MADDSTRLDPRQRERELRFPWVVSGVFLATVVLVFCGWIWCWILPGYCWFCPRCPDCPDPVECPETNDCPDPQAQIVLEDAHSGVWMAIDNEFVTIPSEEREADQASANAYKVCSQTPSMARSCEWPPYSADAYRTGVLFQMGPVAPGDDHYDGVKITFQDDTFVELSPGGFDWIDVNPSGAPCAIDPYNAYSLFQRREAGTPHIVRTQCDDAQLSSGLDTCLRGRELHIDLYPDDAITYWAGNTYYAAFVSGPEAGDAGEDVKFVFDLYDEVTVDVWKEGCLQASHPDPGDLDAPKIREIRIMYQGASTHGGYHDPPMNGGSRL